MQMEIFFFIASVAAIIFLLFATVVGIYVAIIMRRVNAIVREAKAFVAEMRQEGKISLEMIRERVDQILSRGGAIERIVVTSLGTILAKTIKKRAKIKRDAPKK